MEPSEAAIERAKGILRYTNMHGERDAVRNVAFYIDDVDRAAQVAVLGCGQGKYVDIERAQEALMSILLPKPDVERFVLNELITDEQIAALERAGYKIVKAY